MKSNKDIMRLFNLNQTEFLKIYHNMTYWHLSQDELEVFIYAYKVGAKKMTPEKFQFIMEFLTTRENNTKSEDI